MFCLGCVHWEGSGRSERTAPKVLRHFLIAPPSEGFLGGRGSVFRVSRHRPVSSSYGAQCGGGGGGMQRFISFLKKIQEVLTAVLSS